MPEYLYPGVYVDESDSGVTRIDGVSTSTPELMRMSAELAAVVRRHLPGWTDANDDDPGVTLAQLFAFLSETLLYRADGVPERGRAAAARAAASLSVLGHAHADACKPLQRPAFFPGRLLDAATLGAEQDYQREKMRRHNRAIVGFGVVSGLGVHVDPGTAGSGSVIVIEPGYAIDRDGEEIALACGVRLALRDDMPDALAQCAVVTLRFWQRPSEESAATGESVEPAMLEDACVIGLAAEIVSPAIGLARLQRVEDRWQLDAGYTPRRGR